MANGGGGAVDEDLLKTRDGAIVWARVASYPWWPATVMRDPPETAMRVSKNRKKGADYWCVWAGERGVGGGRGGGGGRAESIFWGVCDAWGGRSRGRVAVA